MQRCSCAPIQSIGGLMWSSALNARLTSRSFGEDRQVERLKELEKQNNRLRRAVSELTLDKLILNEAAKRSF